MLKIRGRLEGWTDQTVSKELFGNGWRAQEVLIEERKKYHEQRETNLPARRMGKSRKGW